MGASQGLQMKETPSVKAKEDSLKQLQIDGKAQEVFEDRTRSKKNALNCDEDGFEEETQAGREYR